MVRKLKRSIALCALVLFAWVGLGASSLAGLLTQSPTTSRFLDWQANDARGEKYMGNESCAACHASMVKSHAPTPMAGAIETGSHAGTVIDRPLVTFRQERFTYEIRRKGDQSIYSVSDGVKTISVPLVYAFGKGVIAQTFVFLHDGKYYESRLSYYLKPKALDFTVGQRTTVPATLEAALGRVLGGGELQSCFKCHAPEALNGQKLDLAKFTPGISCESCHGPGEKHILAMKSGDSDDPKIFNPGKLDPMDLTQNFCGSCHISYEQAMLLPSFGGENNVRFQAYRLFSSKGHRSNDPRISCIACHDPHKPIEHDPKFYDAKCVDCHLTSPKETPTATRKAAACPTATKDCASCHMPAVELPGMHAAFRDHWIRVVKPGEPVPR